MANCPKCNGHLKITDWRQHCPHCGANIVVYDLQERLMQQADTAEVQHYHFQKKLDRLKASFVGSKLAVARICTSFIPVAALFLPLAKCRFNLPYSDYEGNVSLLTVYNSIDTITENGIITADKALTACLVLLALSVVMWLVHFALLMLACSKRAKLRGYIINSLLLITSIGAAAVFALNTASPVYSGKLAFGAFLYILLQAVNAAVDMITIYKGIEVRHKQCYVGGIPIEEYFEMQKTLSPEEIRREQYRRLQEQRDAEEARLAEEQKGSRSEDEAAREKEIEEELLKEIEEEKKKAEEVSADE
jgi:hypothetical protein